MVGVHLFVCHRVFGCMQHVPPHSLHTLHFCSLCCHEGMSQAEAASQQPDQKVKKSSPAGALAHHAWVRQWRDRTGGTLAEGRQAWKQLDTKKKWQFKIEFADQVAKTGVAESPEPESASLVSQSTSGASKVGSKIRKARNEQEVGVEITAAENDKPKRLIIESKQPATKSNGSRLSSQGRPRKARRKSMKRE